MLKLISMQCSKCGMISEAFKETDSANNTKYQIFERCSCRDCFFDEVPSAPVVHNRGYSDSDVRRFRGRG